MKNRKNGLPITTEGYPIHINKNKRDFQVFLTHRNGDQTINGWFTYDEKAQHLTRAEGIKWVDNAMRDGVSPDRLRVVRQEWGT